MKDTGMLVDYLEATTRLVTGSRAEQDMAVITMRRMRKQMSTPDLLEAERKRIMLEANLRRDAAATSWFRRMKRRLRAA